MRQSLQGCVNQMFRNLETVIANLAKQRLCYVTSFGFNSMNERQAPLDQMIEFVIEELLSGNPARKQTMVRNLAERWRDQPALAMVFAITSATEAIEDGLRDGAEADDPNVALGYRLSALISADIHAVTCLGQTPPVADDLLHFWRRTDPDFLRLQ